MAQKPSHSNKKGGLEGAVDPSDQELMAGYQAGSNEAFKVIFGRYQNRLFRFISLKASSKKHVSEEVFQKVWLKVHVNRNSFDINKKFSTWIFTIALNTLRDELGSAHERAQFDDIEENVFETSDAKPDEWLQGKELGTRITGALKQISEKQREAILLMNLEGFTSKEAALMMGLTDAAVRQLLFRAHSNLKRILAEEKS